MPAPILIAYDGSPHAEDAVALARLLARATGAPLALAHVYRADAPASPSLAPRGRERFLRRAAERVLEQGAEQLAGLELRRHAVAGTTTATALRELAGREGALALVLGSAHDVAPGRVHPGSAARRLLQVAPCAVAFAPAGYRERDADALARIAFAHDDEDESARRSAELLGEAAPAPAAGPAAGADLLVVGSRASAPAGRVVTNATRDRIIQASEAPVVVVARGVALDRAGAAAAA